MKEYPYKIGGTVPFTCKVWAAGEKIDIRHKIPAPKEYRPTELHILEDGALDNSPTALIVMMNLEGNEVMGQISLNMFSQAIDLLHQMKPKS